MGFHAKLETCQCFKNLDSALTFYNENSSVINENIFILYIEVPVNQKFPVTNTKSQVQKILKISRHIDGS